MPQYDPLAQKRIQRMLRALIDVTEIPSNLIWLARTSVVPATDQEIMARITERSIIADVIADDQRAVVRNDHSISLETVKIPNIKRGTEITQEMLNTIERILAGRPAPGDDDIFENYLQKRLEKILLGVRMQMNLMCVGRVLDSYSWSGLGVQISVNFGMPADLKAIAGVNWATPATATPIADIEALAAVANDKYGKQYDRVTMPKADFNAMVRTQEFRNLASGLRYFNFGEGQFPVQNSAMMKAVAGQLLDGRIIEFDDSQYGREANNGDHSFTRFLPTHKVVLSNSADDNTGAAADFANGIVTETRVGSMSINGAPKLFEGPQYGPVGFATLPNPDLNPPNANLWGVARGFPRKHDLAETAVLTVG